MITKLQPIELQVTQNNWRLFTTRKVDPAFLDFERKIFLRDANQCRYCGFVADQHMEVTNLDGNYLNNRLSNLATTCPFCAQCFFLEAVGKGDFGGGVLVYLPEFSQNELNSICHILFSSIVSGVALSSNAKSVYRDFKLRAQLVEKHIGIGFSNPALYGQVIIDSSSEEALDLHEQFKKKVRLLPSIKRFSHYISSWSESAIESLIV